MEDYTHEDWVEDIVTYLMLAIAKEVVTDDEKYEIYGFLHEQNIPDDIVKSCDYIASFIMNNVVITREEIINRLIELSNSCPKN